MNSKRWGECSNATSNFKQHMNSKRWGAQQQLALSRVWRGEVHKKKKKQLQKKKQRKREKERWWNDHEALREDDSIFLKFFSFSNVNGQKQLGYQTSGLNGPIFLALLEKWLLTLK
jgi:hypothetical protein